MEESGIRNMKKLFAFTVLALLLSVLYGIAGAEQPDAATPTDLECLHVNVKRTVFFFDGPAYVSVSATTHKVSGPATVQVVCLDCGETLSTESSDYEEEIRPHSMKKGQCALCGYKEIPRTKSEQPEDTAGERTLYAQEDRAVKGLLTLLLSRDELLALSKSDVTVALIRGSIGNAAIALDVASVLNQTREAQADLYLELAEREDGSLFAGVVLVSENGERINPTGEGIQLRFYRAESLNMASAIRLAT